MKRTKSPRAPTLEDVARSAGLSPMTVSRALNSPQLVRPKTVEKVMQAVRVTGYIPNALAGGLASRRSKLIAVVVPQINNNMFVDTIQSLSDELARRGYHILLCVAGYTEQTEAELVATLLSRRPDWRGAYRDPSHDRTEKGHPERGYSGGGNLGLNAHAA